MRELRKLNGQLALVAALFVSCIVIAIVLICSRGFFESFLVESYRYNRAAMPAGVPELLAQAESGKIELDGFSKLEEAVQLALYDVWITDENLNQTMPAAMTDVATRQFLERAEHTIVCGTHEQRLRGLKFIEWSNNPEAVARLEYAKNWATRRELEKLVPEIEATLQRIQGREEREEVFN